MKKFVALFLTLVCVLGLTGCNLLFDQELKEEISEIIDESDVQLVTKTYHHLNCNQRLQLHFGEAKTSQRSYFTTP